MLGVHGLVCNHIDHLAAFCDQRMPFCGLFEQALVLFIYSGLTRPKSATGRNLLLYINGGLLEASRWVSDVSIWSLV